MLVFILLNVLIISADVITKNWAVGALAGGDIELLKNALYLSYVENRGAAFGMLSNARILFIAVTIAVVAAILVYVVIKKPAFIPFLCGLAMVSAGGIGNLIDRIAKGYVVDFIDFRLIHFPVFNVADIFVTVGAIFIFVSIIFFEDKIK